MGLRGVAAAIALVAALVVFAGQAEAAVYWPTWTGVARVNVDGSAWQEGFIPSSLTLPSYGGGRCEGIAVTASRIYWAIPTANSIGEANLDGSQPNYQFITGLHDPCGMAVDSTSVYWTEGMGESIGRANLDGGEVDREFVGGLHSPCGVAVAGGYVYWSAFSEESPHEYVGRRPLAGGLDQVLVKTPEEIACGLAVDSEHLYWGGFGESIGRVRFDGGDPEPAFITGVDRPCGVAVQGSTIYWGQNDPYWGAVMAAELAPPHASHPLIQGMRESPCGVAVDSVVGQLPAPPPSPPPPASHFIYFGTPRHAKRAPVTYVAVSFPQGGHFTIGGSRSVRWGVVSQSASPYAVPGAGDQVIKVWPAASGGPAKFMHKQLATVGKAFAAIRVRFAADDGNVSTARQVLSLVAPRPRRGR